MPYYNAYPGQTSIFIETVDALQCFLDKYADQAPVMICGDSNVQLPNATTIGANWFKKPGFSKHSVILYDFLLANNFTVSDFHFKQNVNYTYFCPSRNAFSWIDHVFIMKDYSHLVKSCYIVPLECGNVSDHLPIHTEFFIQSYTDDDDGFMGSIGKPVTKRMRPSWNNKCNRKKYCELVREKLITFPRSHDCLSRDQASVFVNDSMDFLTDSLHDATNASGCAPKKRGKPKAYWCPELSNLRKRKLFWWKIWVESGRPRSGVVYECWKNVKRVFRRTTRQCISKVMNKYVNDMDSFFQQGNHAAFWSTLKRSKRGKQPNSCLGSQDFADHLSELMSDRSIDLNAEQVRISKVVNEYFERQKDTCGNTSVTPDQVKGIIRRLKCNSAPGIDDITSEHIIYANSIELCCFLSTVFSVMINWHVLPDCFLKGIIIPVLKKPCLNPNDVTNFRPITLSSVLSKLLEFLLIPDDHIHTCQFGFRQNRGTAIATSYMFDTFKYFSSKGSPVFVCSLDAEKCFDTIWHHGLFYKLLDKIPKDHWLLLFSWYNNLKACVRFQDNESDEFFIKRGIRQGGILSPILFNYFINDLLKLLSNSGEGLSILNKTFNCCAYADDLTVFASSVGGLQKLIDISARYSNDWKFSFGLKKTSCMTIGKCNWKQEPRWRLGESLIKNVASMTLLGTIFNSNLTSTEHVNSRILACRRSAYGLSSSGLCYPGLSTETKVFLWKSVCQPTLTFALECCTLDKESLTKLESAQGTLVKGFCGISKRSHHTRLLEALDVPKIKPLVDRNCTNLFRNIFKTDSPARDLNIIFLAKFLFEDSDIVKGTLLSKILTCGFNPFDLMLGGSIPPHFSSRHGGDGAIDSLRHLLHDEDYRYRDSLPHRLVKLMLRH